MSRVVFRYTWRMCVVLVFFSNVMLEVEEGADGSMSRPPYEDLCRRQCHWAYVYIHSREVFYRIHSNIAVEYNALPKWNKAIPELCLTSILSYALLTLSAARTFLSPSSPPT
jgi:hypothetical protein